MLKTNNTAGRTRRRFAKHTKCGYKERNFKSLFSNTIKPTMVNNFLHKCPLNNTDPAVKGFMNKNNTIILFIDGGYALSYAINACNLDNFTVIRNEKEMHLDETYTEFKHLQKYANLDSPDFYLLKDLQHPMIAVYIKFTKIEYYLVAPRIKVEDIPKVAIA